MRWQFTLKVINLPRQARDKHRGNIKECRFLAGGCGFCKVQPQRRRHAGPRRDSCAAGGINAFYTKKNATFYTKKRSIYQDRLGTNIEKTQKEMRFFSQEDAKFVVDESYVDGVADMFGTWDTDGSGGVELAEFRELWAQLELGGMLQEAGVAAAAEEVDVPPPPPFHDELAPPPPPFNGPFDRSAAQTSAENAATSSEQGADVAEQIFVRWNQNGDAILDMAEVEDMLEACAFEIDAQYIDGLADLFGTFDQDDSGVISAYNLRPVYTKHDLFTKTGSGQTQGKHSHKRGRPFQAASSCQNFG